MNAATEMQRLRIDGWALVCALLITSCRAREESHEHGPAPAVATRPQTYAPARKSAGTITTDVRSQVSPSTPRPGLGPLIAGPFKQVLAAGDSTCGLRTNGTVFCWGDTSAKLAASPRDRLTAIAAATNHLCGLHKDGTVVCWGEERNHPPPSERGLTHLSVEDNVACAVAQDGSLVCWGDQDWTTRVSQPIVLTAAAGPCALQQDGKVVCYRDGIASTPDWLASIRATEISGDASNSLGKSGCILNSEHLASCVNLPTEPPRDLLHGLSAGSEVACALDADRRVRCWGNPENPASQPPSAYFDQVSVGRMHACGLTSNGSVQCWGDNTSHQLLPLPQRLPTTTKALAYGEMPDHSSLITAIGDTYERDSQGYVFSWPRWGPNGITGRDSHRVIFGYFTDFDASANCQCGIHLDGALDCFGSVEGLPSRTRFAKVAVGNFVYQTPERPSDSAFPKDLGCHVCAIDLKGKVHCAGANERQQSNAPSGLFRSIAASSRFTCGVRLDGELVCWGAGMEHGPNASDQRLQRLLRRPTGKFADISIGKYPQGYQSCGLRADGSVECWANQDTKPQGLNDEQFEKLRRDRARGLFHPSISDPCPSANACGMDSPTGYKFTQLSSGLRHNCGITVEGTVHCWGNNAFKQLDAPSGPFSSVVAGDDFSCAMRSEGTVECWGKGFSVPIQDAAKE
jgi:alpha-tubulin suppressor-like RCC1 family protein